MILESFSIYNNDFARETRVRERQSSTGVFVGSASHFSHIRCFLSNKDDIPFVWPASDSVFLRFHSRNAMYSPQKKWNAFHCNRKGNGGRKRTHAPRAKKSLIQRMRAPVNFCLNDYYMAPTSYVASDGVHIFCRSRFTITLNRQMKSGMKSGISFDKPNRLTFPVCQIHCASLETYTPCYRQVIAIHTLK